MYDLEAYPRVQLLGPRNSNGHQRWYFTGLGISEWKEIDFSVCSDPYDFLNQ